MVLKRGEPAWNDVGAFRLFALNRHPQSICSLLQSSHRISEQQQCAGLHFSQLLLLTFQHAPEPSANRHLVNDHGAFQLMTKSLLNYSIGTEVQAHPAGSPHRFSLKRRRPAGSKFRVAMSQWPGSACGTVRSCYGESPSIQ